MAKRNRLTNNSDETDIASLISGDVIFSIPYFQRPYKWKPERLKQLNEDLLAIVDQSVDFHFLGAVIVHGRRSNPSDPDVYEVIDGQQRITTIFLYLAAIIRTLCLHDNHQEAAGLFQKYLVISRDTGALSNYKLHSSKEDRAQLNEVFKDILSDQELVKRIGGIEIRPLIATGEKVGVLRRNYTSILRFLKAEAEQEGGLDRVRQICQCLLNLMSVVQIDVWDPTNGPKIFDSLNSRQEPMTIGDLVRNEIFSRVAAEKIPDIELVDQQYWQPFYKRFESEGKNLFDSYFFPFGLVLNPNLRKSEVYSFLRDSWEKENDPKAIIRSLEEYQPHFLDIVHGTNLSKHEPLVARAFGCLRSARPPSATLPFLMQLSRAVQTNRVAADKAISILQVIESFLVRRAICGHEPTGLHAVFKRLWPDMANDLTPEGVTKAIAKHKTVVWPGDAQFTEAIATRPLYGSSITLHVILEYNRSLGGDTPNAEPHIEHVLPDTLSDGWRTVFSREDHEKLKDTLANLLPLSPNMNCSLGNSDYPAKRARYEVDSMFKATRQFAAQHVTWNPQSLAQRALEIQNWGLKRWPHAG